MIKEWSHIAEDGLALIGEEVKGLVKKPALIILSGVVGAGKTSFVKKFQDDIDALSPTYSVINDFGSMLHADFYRIENAEEIAHLELELYIDHKDYIFIEWGLEYKNIISQYFDEKIFKFYHMSFSILDREHRSLQLTSLEL